MGVQPRVRIVSGGLYHSLQAPERWLQPGRVQPLLPDKQQQHNRAAPGEAQAEHQEEFLPAKYC